MSILITRAIDSYSGCLRDLFCFLLYYVISLHVNVLDFGEYKTHNRVVDNMHLCLQIYTYLLMDIMWPASQSHFHLLFIFIEMNFYLLSFLCDVYNEVHEHMQ